MLNDDGGATNARKRKMKEVAAEPIPSPQPTANQISQFVPLYGSQSSQVQRLLNAAAPLNPFSYYFRNSLPSMGQHINQIIAFHNENLKNALYGTMDKLAEEHAAKKINEKELEIHAKSSQNAKLEQQIELYSGQIERLLIRSRSWERTVAHLRRRLEDVNEARGGGDSAEEDAAESSYMDDDRVEPMRLDCKVCETYMATVMLWPCRHVCVCTKCNDAIKVCPVCGTRKISTVDVCIPTDD